jgi:hypothetical protein
MPLLGTSYYYKSKGLGEFSPLLAQSRYNFDVDQAPAIDIIRPRLVQRSGRWYALVNFGGKRTYRTLKTRSEEEAKAKFAALHSLGLVEAVFPRQRQILKAEIRLLWKKAKDHARVRKLPFELRTEDVRTLYAECGGQCAVSGLPFDYEPHAGTRRRPFAPSIDRIDCSRGYAMGNVRLVCNMVNQAMGEWGEVALLRIATAMVLKHQR